MRSFNRGGRSRPRKSFNRNRYRQTRSMHPAVCAQCGRECEVPFRPTESKPVYCSDCFEKMEKRDEGRFSTGSKFSQKRTDFGLSKFRLEKIEEKLDKILTLLEKKEEVLRKSPKRKKEPKK